MLELEKVLAQFDFKKHSAETEIGNSQPFYAGLYEALCTINGRFSLAYRIDPFKGPETALDWDKEWQKFCIAEWDVQAWLGTGLEWVQGELTRPGRTSVRVYEACDDTKSLFCRVPCLFAWRRPLPEDFAAYTHD